MLPRESRALTWKPARAAALKGVTFGMITPALYAVSALPTVPTCDYIQAAACMHACAYAREEPSARPHSTMAQNHASIISHHAPTPKPGRWHASTQAMQARKHLNEEREVGKEDVGDDPR